MPRTPIRVAVVNDYDVVVAGVAAMLKPYVHRVSVGAAVAPDGSDVDVLLYDTFATVAGLRRLEELVTLFAKVIVFSWPNSEEQIEVSRRAGASSFLSKAATAVEIVTTIEVVASGPGWTEPSPDPQAESGQLAAWPGQQTGLSRREAEVVAQLTRGLTNQQIAAETYLSVNTVKTYIRGAYAKMGVTSRAQAVRWGLEHGFGSR